MPDDLTNDQIALLCDIGDRDRTKLADDKQLDLERLISLGFVDLTGSRPGFNLTAKGAAFLGERGAGLNEA